MQDIRRRVTACFVALTDEQRIAGFYTLASASVLLSDLPASLSRKLPRYPSVPTIRLGRLAVINTSRARVWGAPCWPMPGARPALRNRRLCPGGSRQG